MKLKITKSLKKMLAAAAALLLTCIPSFAQLNVESFEAKESDQDARVAYPVKDKNGKICALIKLMTHLKNEDFEFDVGMINIEKREQKKGVVWIYLPGGAQRITITHTNFEKGVQNYEFPTGPLKEATVYAMQLRSANVRQVVDDEGSTGTLVIKCSIKGASVSIDSETPKFFDNGFVDVILPYGKHTYVVSAGELYHEAPGSATVKKGRTDITVSLKPKFGKLTVKTNPEGADLYIDGGVDAKKSPFTDTMIRSGEHKIRAVKNLYQLSETRVTIADGEDKEHVVTLQPDFAEITLVSEQGGTIFVDGVRKGASRWSGKLLAGLHKLEVKKNSHSTRTKEITVVAGNNQEIALPTMDPIYGKLNVRADVLDAAITIDGKLQNEKAPFKFEKLLIGEYSVMLTAEGYKTQEKLVKVTEGETTSVEFKMEEAEQIARVSIRASVSGAAISVDGKSVGTAPVSLSDIPLSRGQTKTVTVSVTAAGYETFRRTVTLQPGDNEVYAALTEIPIGTLKISANTYARVEVDGRYEGYTPATVSDVSVGNHTVSFSASGYKGDKKSVYVRNGENSVYGYLKARPQPTFFVDYQASMTTPGGFSLGYCQRFGTYVRFRGSLMDVSADELAETASSMSLRKSDVSGLEKEYFRRAYTAGGMLRIAKWLYAYGGLGYGQYGVSYNLGERDGKNVYYNPQMVKGIEWEAGAKLRASIFTANLGYNAIANSKFGELHFGAGLAFNEETVEGFAGSDERHEAFGKFHLRAGYTVGGVESSSMGSMVHLDLHYNNSRAFGINGDLGMVFGDNAIMARAGMYSSYFMGDHFAIDYGLGYQIGEILEIDDHNNSSLSGEISEPYFKLGASVMFNGNSWGGFNYSYTRGFGSGSSPKFFTHNISYTVGQFPTIVIGGVTVVVGLIALIAVLAAESESSEPTY
ncbi:MAG: PEGA domain-containing protein [Prevotellaceae bacterium]|jgi:hypothetical protein|nr:PEGA domain-containing protein [Prevotellaceae bacterium]